MAKAQKGGDQVVIDLPKTFKLTADQKKKLENDGPEGLLDYDKKLPNGDAFIARFRPVTKWKVGLQGFNIHGLERSLQVTRHADTHLNRAEAIAMVKTLLKPGDAELEDVFLCHADKTEKKVEAKEEPAEA